MRDWCCVRVGEGGGGGGDREGEDEGGEGCCVHVDRLVVKELESHQLKKKVPPTFIHVSSSSLPLGVSIS